jgi:hypothetical protein
MVRAVGDAGSAGDKRVGSRGETDESVAAERRAALRSLARCAGPHGIGVALEIRGPPGKWVQPLPREGGSVDNRSERGVFGQVGNSPAASLPGICAQELG